MASEEPSSLNGGGKRKSAAGTTQHCRWHDQEQAKTKPKIQTKSNAATCWGREAVELPLSLIQTRTEYPQGFSTRKKEKTGLRACHAKGEDRKARLESRSEIRTAMREQVEEAEKQRR
jgi:hypothetical protein